jgi:hypothetical protein
MIDQTSGGKDTSTYLAYIPNASGTIIQIRFGDEEKYI